MSLVSLFKRQYTATLSKIKNNKEEEQEYCCLCSFYCSVLLLVVYSLSGGVDTNQAVFMYKWIVSQ